MCSYSSAQNKSEARDDCQRLAQNLFNDVISTTEDMGSTS